MSQRGAQRGFTFTRPGGSNQPRTLLTHSGVSVIAPSAGACSRLHRRAPRVTQTHAVVGTANWARAGAPTLHLEGFIPSVIPETPYRVWLDSLREHSLCVSGCLL